MLIGARAVQAAGAFLSGAVARHLAARFSAPGTMLIGRGLEVAGVVVLALLLGPDTSGWLGPGHRVRRGHPVHRPRRRAPRGPGRRRPHRSGGRLARLSHAGLGRHHDPAAAGAGRARPARGAHGAAVDALTAGFADAARWALLIAAVFLVLGFIGALRLRRASGNP
ncbi:MULTISPECIES: hypothetical protein [Micrococcus]|uniref:Uncharacterized protein n=1 Tax=Micrococcus yunnanensis TaxID=566027 RepID=A0AAP5T7C5_9MICC|nr:MULTISPECIES: hypothetical protein [Micrococcus]MDV7177382.1 hypothetical protein [Micrococcus yunnanensis]WRQ42920.1 hypothetical protein SOY78_07810 [Micrococcus sp. HOU1]